MAQTTLTPNLQRLALANVCLGQFLSALDSRSVNVALPTISLHFDASMAAVQWIPLAYQLTIVGLVLSMARLGDKLGRKGLYTLGFIMLGVGSAACGLSPYLWLIVCFRAIEGIGGALVLANGRAIASALYAKEGRGRALGMMSMSFHLGYITGPSVGGFLVDTIGWRWIFFMNLPVALAAATMAWKILPETVTEKRDYSIDPHRHGDFAHDRGGFDRRSAASGQERLRSVAGFAGRRGGGHVGQFCCSISSGAIRRRCSICRFSKFACSPPEC